jgi:hypothetical protein
MDVKDVKNSLKYYKANYPLKKDEINKLTIMVEFIDFIEDDETEFNIKLYKIIKYLNQTKQKIGDKK